MSGIRYKNMGIESLYISEEELKYKEISSYFDSSYLFLNKGNDGFKLMLKNSNSYENIPGVIVRDSNGKTVSLPLKLKVLPEVIFANYITGNMMFRYNGMNFAVQSYIQPRFPDIINAFERLKIRDIGGNKVLLSYKIVDNGLLIGFPDRSKIILSNTTLQEGLSKKMKVDSGMYTLLFDRHGIFIYINPIAVLNHQAFTIYLDNRIIMNNEWYSKYYFRTDMVPIEYLEYTNDRIILSIPGGKSIFFDKDGNLLDGQKLTLNEIEAGFMRFFASHGLPFLSGIDAGTYLIKVNQKARTIYLKKTPN